MCSACQDDESQEQLRHTPVDNDAFVCRVCKRTYNQREGWNMIDGALEFERLMVNAERLEQDTALVLGLRDELRRKPWRVTWQGTSGKTYTNTFAKEETAVAWAWWLDRRQTIQQKARVWKIQLEP